MNGLRIQFGKRTSIAAHSLKEAVLASFREPRAEVAAKFCRYSESEWHQILFWLDISGMALYLLHQLRTLDIEESVPGSIRKLLETNLHHNRLRAEALLRDAGMLAYEFQQSGIAFALMKGVTLVPDSVPDPALRCQTDLDFLVDESHIGTATAILLSLGYFQHAVSGRTVEFRQGAIDKPDLANLYRAETQRSLELHLYRRDETGSDRLTRSLSRSFGGLLIPTQTSADVLVQQALHLLKHLCGEHTRVSWLLEFWRHVRGRQDDRIFWDEVQAIAVDEPKADMAMAISLWLANNLFGHVEIGAADHWKEECIPMGARLWLNRFSHELLLSDSLGTKLYLLLRRHFTEPEDRMSTIRRIFPLVFPARITHPAPSETLVDKFSRYQIEAAYAWQRLCFHVFEGARYLFEALSWERDVARMERQ